MVVLSSPMVGVEKDVDGGEGSKRCSATVFSGGGGGCDGGRSCQPNCAGDGGGTRRGGSGGAIADLVAERDGLLRRVALRNT